MSGRTCITEQCFNSLTVSTRENTVYYYSTVLYRNYSIAETTKMLEATTRKDQFDLVPTVAVMSTSELWNSHGMAEGSGS